MTLKMWPTVRQKAAGGRHSSASQNRPKHVCTDTFVYNLLLCTYYVRAQLLLRRAQPVYRPMPDVSPRVASGLRSLACVISDMLPNLLATGLGRSLHSATAQASWG